MVVTRCNYHRTLCTLRSWTLRACAVLAASALWSTELGTVGTADISHVAVRCGAENRTYTGRGDGMAAHHNSYVVILSIKTIWHKYRIFIKRHTFTNHRIMSLSSWEEKIIDHWYYWVYHIYLYHGWFYKYCHVIFYVCWLICPRPVPCHHHVARCQE